MDSIKLILGGIFAGIRDAIRGMTTVKYLHKSVKQNVTSSSKEPPATTLAKRRAQAGKVRPKVEETKVIHRIFQCCALNGGIFWFSILMFSYVVLPSLQLLMNMIFGSSPRLAGTIWIWLKPTLAYTFSALWVLPLFVLSKVVNSLWFQDIADSAYRHTRGRPQLMSSLSKLVADTLFSVLIQALFLLQSFLVSLLPITALGQTVSLIHLCLLYSLYAFEYKWINMGWELHKRLSFIEQNWPYFIGFGLPLAILTSLPSSYVISGCVFSILFPLYIISANEATPLTETCEYRLQLFSPVVSLSNAIFHHTIQPKGSK